MNEEIAKGKWTEYTADVKKKWAKLTDDDFLEVKADYQKLIGKVQQRYGYQLEEARNKVDQFFSEVK